MLTITLELPHVREEFAQVVNLEAVVPLVQRTLGFAAPALIDPLDACTGMYVCSYNNNRSARRMHRNLRVFLLMFSPARL